MRAMTFFDYEKLSDDILFLGNNVVLRLNVGLGRTNNKNNERVSAHKEYMYASNKYIDADRLITLRRSFDYYLTLENSNMREASVMIRVQDILLLRAKINEALMWFDNGTFAIKNKSLYIVRTPQPIIMSGFPDNKIIKFEPIVIQWDETQLQQQGIRMTFGIEDCYVDIPIDKFYGFVYIISTINMFESGQLLLNYLGRPEYGSNMMSFEETPIYDNSQINQTNPMIPKSPKQKIPRVDKTQGSFFDKNK